MPALPIPSRASDLSAEWLTDALRAGGVIAPPARVLAVNATPIAEDRSFAGRVIRVRLEYERAPADAPRSLIVKLPAADPAMSRALSGLGWYESEIRFYEQIAPASTLSTPRRYHSDLDGARQRYILLLEDVTSGGVGDQIAGASPEQARAVVREIAAFHAQWWNDPRIEAMHWLARGAVRPVATVERWQAFYRYGWAVTRELVPGLLDGPVAALGDALEGAYARVLLTTAEPPWTVIHGDCRLDNVLFSPGDAPPVFIDWQMVSRGRGVYDVAYFLGTNVATGTRRDLEMELLREYHSIATSTAAPAAIAGRDRSSGGAYSFDQCLRDYRLAMLLVFGFWVQTAGAATFPEAAHPLRDAALGRCAAALIDLEAGDLLPGA